MTLKMIPSIFTLLCTLFCSVLNATTLDDLKPHVPSSDKTWAEQWFYNVAVPDVGYFKISLQTYIAPNFTTPTPKAYVHLAFTPLNGKTVKYDIFRDELILKGFNDVKQFHYEIPGIVMANQDQLEVHYNDFNFTMRWDGEHSHYWRGSNPGQTPFGIIPEIMALVVNGFFIP